MEHRHLILAYTVTWVLQLGYAAWVGLQWVKLKKTERTSAASQLHR